MTNSQLKSVQENITSIRELIIPMLRSSDDNMKTLAIKLSDRCIDIEMELCNPEPDGMTKSYNLTSNRIEKIYPVHTEFEEWKEKNRDIITEYIAKYPDNFTPDMTRYNMEMKLWARKLTS